MKNLPTDTFLWRLRRFSAGEEAVRRLHQEVHGAELTDERGPLERKSCRQEFFMEIEGIARLTGRALGLSWCRATAW